MTKNTATPQVSLSEIRQIYPHLPEGTVTDSVMHHPAILVFVHDPEAAANAVGQIFLHKNNDFDKRGSQPLAVAASMTGADYKIFDLSPPTRQPSPASENDVALAISYGMVTVEQGVDYIALAAIGQETDVLLPQIKSLTDLAKYNAMNIAACYGAYTSARMAEIPLTAPSGLMQCLNAIAADENIGSTNKGEPDNVLENMALNLIRKAAAQRMRA